LGIGRKEKNTATRDHTQGEKRVFSQELNTEASRSCYRMYPRQADIARILTSTAKWTHGLAKQSVQSVALVLDFPAINETSKRVRHGYSIPHRVAKIVSLLCCQLQRPAGFI
jgi:hypothetical protein